MIRIQVQSVVLPDGLAREPKSLVRHTDGQPLQVSDLLEYDSRTLLFDVFWRADESILRAVGPPLLNLEARLLPVRARVNGAEAPVRLEKISDRSLISLEVKAPTTAPSSVELELRFGDAYTWRGEVRRDAPLPPARLSLTTIQKDNSLRWIVDWRDYYERAHGVDRVVLYDNGSREPIPDLAPLPAGVMVVDWRFPYGPKHSHPNKFTQTGALNHMKLRFGTRSSVLVFDIDELLVVKSRAVRWLIERAPGVRFDNYYVPFIAPSINDYSFTDFMLRETRPKGASYKYSYRPPYVHSVTPHAPQSRLRNRTWAPIVPVRSAYFLHYMGITTNWKAEYWDRKRSVEARLDLVNDSAVSEVLGRK